MNDPYVSSEHTEDERDAAYGIDVLRAQLAHANAALDRVRALADQWDNQGRRVIHYDDAARALRYRLGQQP